MKHTNRNLNEQVNFAYHKKPNKTKVLSDMLKENFAATPKNQEEVEQSKKCPEFGNKSINRGIHQLSSTSN